MKISVKSSTMVKPMADTPGGTLWLSNLDLLMPTNYHTQALYFYRSDGTAADFFDTTVLMEALSRVLVEFYPYAGRLKKGESNRLEIDCNDEGVLFVEEECDGSLNDLGDFAPKAGLSLIPTVDYSQGISTFPLLLLQLSRFKCGGVCLGIANEHHLSDGTCALHFKNSWSDIARGNPIGIRPFFDRTLLSAHHPPQPIFPHVEYHPPPQLLTPLDADSETAYSVLKITPDQLKALKAECNDNYSSYEVLGGHVWRCVSTARGLPAHQKTKLNIPVDGRNRLRPPLPPGFFGNAIFTATAIAACGELSSNPLSYAVSLVHSAIVRMDDEYLRSAVDYLELEGDVCAKARGAHTTKCPNLHITSWTRLPAYDTDFGWGKPVYIGPGAPPFEGKSYVLKNPDAEGGLLYAITLHKQHINLFHNLFYQFN